MSIDVHARVAAPYRPAIDAYMASHPSFFDIRKMSSAGTPSLVPGEPSVPIRSAYGYRMGVDDGSTQRYIVEPPASDGTGGGRILLCVDAHDSYEVEYRGDPHFFVNKFAAIRQSLQDRFWNFHDLPQPAEFSVELASITAAIQALALDFNVMSTWAAAPDSDANPEHTDAPSPSSQLHTELKFVFDALSNSESFSGQAIRPMRARYNDGLQVATRAIYGLLYVYGAHIAAEQALWKEVNKSLDNLLTELGNGFNAAAHQGSSIKWGEVLTVLGFTFDALALLASATGVGAPAAAVIRGVGLGVTIVDEYVSDAQEPQHDSMHSYDEVCAAMISGIDALRATVLSIERQIEQDARANVESIKAHCDQYDLKGGLFDDQDRVTNGFGEQIAWNSSAASDVVAALRRAAPYYALAGQKLANTGIWDAAKRMDYLGTSRTGPAQDLDDLGSSLRALLIALAEELELGATAIEAANALFRAGEDEHTKNIVRLESEIDLTTISELTSPDTVLDPVTSEYGSIQRQPLDIRSIMNGCCGARTMGVPPTRSPQQHTRSSLRRKGHDSQGTRCRGRVGGCSPHAHWRQPRHDRGSNIQRHHPRLPAK